MPTLPMSERIVPPQPGQQPAVALALTPPPFDPPDLPVAWSALGATARKALARLWQHGDQPGSAAGAELLAAHLVSGVSGAYSMELRGYQLAAWASGAGGLP